MRRTWLLPALALAALAAYILLRTRRSDDVPTARKEPPYAL